MTTDFDGRLVFGHPPKELKDFDAFMLLCRQGFRTYKELMSWAEIAVSCDWFDRVNVSYSNFLLEPIFKHCQLLEFIVEWRSQVQDEDIEGCDDNDLKDWFENDLMGEFKEITQELVHIATTSWEPSYLPNDLPTTKGSLRPLFVTKI